MRNALARIDLTEPSINLGQEDQALDRIIERGIGWKVLQGLQTRDSVIISDMSRFDNVNRVRIER